MQTPVGRGVISDTVYYCRKQHISVKTPPLQAGHSFVASALRIGLSINDLKELTYVDVMKILISYIDRKNGEKKPTQSQIEMLTG